MAMLSPARLSVPILDGLELINRGKVRDTYRLPPDPRLEERLGRLLLIVASDGVSIYDFVLNAQIPYKGYVLTAMTHFWLSHLASTGIKTHLVAAGSDIDRYLPRHLCRNTDLQRRAMVVMQLDMIPIEFIARFYLTGSVLKEYQKKGTVYGEKLPPDLKDGDKLPKILFTPTTKAALGHDVPMDADGVRNRHRAETCVFIEACQRCLPIAHDNGVLVADTKGELGYDKKKRIIHIGDEWFTPDSSRFWDANEHAVSRENPERTAPQAWDKQVVRTFGKAHGIDALNPENSDDVAKAHSLTVPANVSVETAQRYLAIFHRLTNLSIEEYARERMRIVL